jgi:hypothetical protein
LGRQHYELLKPLVNRVYSILLRRGKIKAAPEKIQGKTFEVHYSSMIARAQRSSEAENLNRIMGIMGPIAQFEPSVLDNVDADKILKYVASIYNVPQLIFRRADDMAKIREQRQQAMAQQQAEQSALNQTKSLQQASGAMNGQQGQQ